MLTDLLPSLVRLLFAVLVIALLWAYSWQLGLLVSVEVIITLIVIRAWYQIAEWRKNRAARS